MSDEYIPDENVPDENVPDVEIPYDKTTVGENFLDYSPNVYAAAIEQGYMNFLSPQSSNSGQPGASAQPSTIKNEGNVDDSSLINKISSMWGNAGKNTQSQILAMLGLGIAGMAAMPAKKRAEDRENRRLDIQQQEVTNAERQREIARTSTGEALAKYQMPDFKYAAPKYNGLLANMTPQGK